MVRLLKKIIQPVVWFFKLSWLKKIKVALITFFSGVLLGVLALVIFYYAVAGGVFGEIPTDKELQEINNYEASQVFSADSVLLGRYYQENRTDVKYEDVSPIIINGLIATEDSRFYEHKGIDQISLMRVLFKSILLGQNKGGGSTLSQQLAKNVFGRKSYGVLTMPVNKMRESIIANKMENLYSKEEILMLYLNTVSFGEDTYGISTACERFFSTTPKDIKQEEAAVLIGMLKSPTIFNPRTHPETSLDRRNVVLHQLYANNFLSLEEKDSLQNLLLELNYKLLTYKNGEATHFREHLRQYLDEWLKTYPKPDGSFYNLYTDGLTIKTTINYQLQVYAEEAVLEHLAEMQPILTKDLKRNKVFEKQAKTVLQLIKKSDRYKALIKTKITEKEALQQFEVAVATTLTTTKGEVDTLISPKDSIIYNLSQLQAGFLVINPISGDIMAWVGGTSMKISQYDHVTSKRQVGSVFKPIIYAQALISGKKPCDYISNQAVTYTQYENWSPKNSDNNYEGRFSIAGALANSINTISVKLCMNAGIKNVIKLAHELGIDEEFPEVPSIALGVVETSLLKLVSAYTAFANSGIYSNPQFVAQITDNSGKILFKQEIAQKEVIPEEVTHDMINMMQGVVNNGTANRLRSRYGIKGAIAGKTGTTQSQKDAWFMGVTPNWIGGVWVGADYPFVHFSSIVYGQGASAALPIWANFYKKIEKDNALNYLVKSVFDFENTIDCEAFKEDNLFQQIFKSKNKKDNRTGTDKKKKRERRKRKSSKN